MKKRSDKSCMNAWFQYLAIFSICAITLFTLFELKVYKVKLSEFFAAKPVRGSILIAASGRSPSSPVAVDFEASPVFILVTEHSGRYEYLMNTPNYKLHTMQRFIQMRNIRTVIAGTMTIATFEMLGASQVDVYTGVTGTVQDALLRLEKKKLVSYSNYYRSRISASAG